MKHLVFTKGIENQKLHLIVEKKLLTENGKNGMIGMQQKLVHLITNDSSGFYLNCYSVKRICFKIILKFLIRRDI